MDTITNTDDLYTITRGTILLDDNKECFIKWTNIRGETYFLGHGDDYRWSPADIILPARVLYTPEQETPDAR